MKYFYIIMTCLSLILAPFVKIKAQGSELYHVVKTSNGQSFILNSNGSTGTIYTDIYFRIGPIYEFDSLSGISMVLSKFINARINAVLKQDGRQIKYTGTVEPEQIGFHFESAPADLDYVLKLANDKIMYPGFDQQGIDEAKAKISIDLDSLKGQGLYSRETRIMQKTWGNDYKNLNPYGDQQTYKRLKAADLAAFQKRYFLPSNNMICLFGSFSEKVVLDKLQAVFKDFKSTEFNPELIDKVIDFKPIINTVQLVTTGSDTNIASVTYQNPGARQDRSATYCAYILIQLINDKEGRIQRSLLDSGLREPKAVYLCNNFYGTFILSAQPAGNNFFDAFTLMNHLINDIGHKDYFQADEIEKAKANILVEYNNLKTNNLRTFMSLVARYRFSNDENYFTGLADSIKAVTLEQLRTYINDYFADHSGVRNLTTSESALKNTPVNEQYFPLDESVTDIKFTYDLNKSDIETDEAKQNLRRVIQWLTINTDAHIQINGFADEGEFTKAYDDSVLRFIDSTATFHKAMPDATKKGYLRIEFMRAMKIAKAIYEAGITPDRITGTSMVFTSDTKEAAAANRKCTLTIEKIRPHPSLYEYHFGRKPPEPDMGER